MADARLLQWGSHYSGLVVMKAASKGQWGCQQDYNEKDAHFELPRMRFSN